jgi:dihydropyrimidinase
VLDGRITINRFVELTSTNPAKAYGLHPRKGTIAIGADADLVVWAPRRARCAMSTCITPSTTRRTKAST